MENFHLEKEETLFSIVDRVKRSRDKDIVLNVPAGLTVLKSIVNLKILKEEALSLEKNISISTNDSFIKNFIKRAGIELLEDIEQSIDVPEKSQKTMSDIVGLKNVVDLRPKKPEIIQEPEIKPIIESEPVIIKEETPYGRPLDDLGAKEEQFEELFRKEPEKQIEPESEILQTKYKFEGPKTKSSFFTKKKVIGFLIFIALIALGFVIYFVLPRAQIVISPKKEIIKFETEIAVDRDVDSIDSDANIIPGQIFEIEMQDSKKFPTTGEKDLREKAKGVVIIYNQYSSEDQSLVKTTRFLSDSGKLFRLVDTVVIPGAKIIEGQIIASSKEVELIADEEGEEYNIAPSKFTIPGFKGTPKYTGFYGESSDSMSGGIIGRFNVATKDDIDGAKEILGLELKDKVYKEFIKKIPKDLTLLENAQVLEIIESNSSLEVDEPGKEFTITVKVRAIGLAFKEENAISLIKDNLKDKISEDKTLLPSTISIEYNNPEIDLENGRIEFSCNAEAKTAVNIDQNKFKSDLAGKNEIEVRKYLSGLSEIESAKVVFWPFWVKKIPINLDKIKIVVDTEN
ncbi:hypothetical protein KKA23_01005 [Patescibacteria group bacterium]|nr:hypothetical protein [Patescibacteria group bacterium]